VSSGAAIAVDLNQTSGTVKRSKHAGYTRGVAPLLQRCVFDFVQVGVYRAQQR
jgi:hypothetical protein